MLREGLFFGIIGLEGGINMKFWVPFLTILVVFTATLFAQQDMGARPLGMGRAFIALADDGNAPCWNPSGMSLYTDRVLSGMFSRLYMGITGDALGEGYLTYVYPSKRHGSFGLSFEQFFSNLWMESEFAFSYSYLFPKTFFRRKLSVGGTMRVLRNEVVKSNIEYTPQLGDPENGIGNPLDDDYFQKNGWDRWGFTANLGLHYSLTPELALALLVANINEPNMTLGSVVGEKLPLTVNLGTAYKFRNSIYYSSQNCLISLHEAL